MPDEEKQPYVEQYARALPEWKQKVADERAAFDAANTSGKAAKSKNKMLPANPA